MFFISTLIAVRPTLSQNHKARLSKCPGWDKEQKASTRPLFSPSSSWPYDSPAPRPCTKRGDTPRSTARGHPVGAAPTHAPQATPPLPAPKGASLQAVASARVSPATPRSSQATTRTDTGRAARTPERGRPRGARRHQIRTQEEPPHAAPRARNPQGD
jgi:hypothetical protein